MTKTIDVDQLKPGMFIERMDRSWLTTPFFRHRFLLRDHHEIAELKRHGIRRVVIDPAKGLDVEEAPPPPAPATPGTARRDEPAHPRPASPEAPTAKAPTREDIDIARAVHAEAVSAIQRILEGITTAVRLDSPALTSMVSRIRDRLTSHHAAMMTAIRLQQLKRFDGNIFAHVVDTSVLAMAVGLEQGLDEQQLEELGMSALLHDIGELRLPRNLFRKQGPLTDQERALIQQHPSLGTTMLTDSQDVSESIRRTVAEHHERFDGSGYPNGLCGTAIAPFAQLVGLVDVYDALVTSRHGRPAMTPPQAIRQVYQLGLSRQFDQALVEHMIQCLGVYPIGSIVELSTGERAVVVAINSRLRVKPSLKIISDPKGRIYRAPLLVDLSMPDPGPVRSISRDVDPLQERWGIEDYLEGA